MFFNFKKYGKSTRVSNHENCDVAEEIKKINEEKNKFSNFIQLYFSAKLAQISSVTSQFSRFDTLVSCRFSIFLEIEKHVWGDCWLSGTPLSCRKMHVNASKIRRKCHNCESNMSRMKDFALRWDCFFSNGTRFRPPILFF